ncbi:MAG TPA: hypothetical protein VJP80_05600 [Candidatus Saccharimonadales bacterium]|nr:hypothetical protein [Candidatus Saccharimonadales bacterium]
MKHKRIWQAAALGVGIVVSLLSPVAWAQNVTQGYESDQNLENGLIVRLKPTDTKKVEPCKLANAGDMLGVTVASTDAPVSLSDPTRQQVFVATFGQYEVLVSNQNGAIKAGDFITISSLDGVAMKADHTDQYVLGKALEGFAGLNDADSHVTLTGSQGTKRTVGLKRIMVDISVAHNPSYSGDKVAGVPQFLTNIARSVTDKPLTALRIYAAAGALLFALLVAGWVLYAGIRSGLTAVGRNPLAKSAIMRSLVSVILSAIVVVIVGLIAVYLLLKI